MSKRKHAVSALTAILLSGLAIAGESNESSQITLTFRTREAVAKAFSNLNLTRKDEFESSEDFVSRKCSLIYQKAGGEANTTFHFPVFGRGALSQAYYDVDKHTYRFLGTDVFPGMYNSIQTKSNTGLILSQKSTPGKSYVGQNAFGVSKQINVSHESTIAIVLPTEKFGPLPNFTLQAEPELARQLKGDLQLIVSTKISPPCVETGTYYSGPTIDSPSETTDNLTAVIGSSDATWEIVRTSSGEILASGHF